MRSLELFDPQRRSWETLPVRLARGRHDHAALLLPDCRVLLVGGLRSTSGETSTPRELELVTIPVRR